MTHYLDDTDIGWYAEHYPTLSGCTLKYIQAANRRLPPTTAETHTILQLIWRARNDSALRDGAIEGLDSYERGFLKCRELLGVSTDELYSLFSFRELKREKHFDPFHDFASEIFLVPNLHDHGFRRIRKLKKSEKPTADFTAVRKGIKYAIELKLVRPGELTHKMERTPDGSIDLRPSESVGRIGGRHYGQSELPEDIAASVLSFQMEEARRKIEDKQHKALKQVANTQSLERATHGIVVVENKEVPKGAVFDEPTRDELEGALRLLARSYDQLDHIGLIYMNSNDEGILFAPRLPRGFALLARLQAASRTVRRWISAT